MQNNSNRSYSTASFVRLLLFLFLITGGIGTARDAHAQENPNGPIYLFTQYRCSPANRAPFMQYMRTTGLNRFEEWKRNGTIADYQILFNSFVDADTWDMMIQLKFARYADSERWYAVADTMPGGLDAAGLALAQPFNTVVADLTWQDQGTTPANAKEAIYFVIPYQYTDKGIYMKYFGVYVLPQLLGWLRSGIMSGYKIFMNNHATGDIWDVLFMLEYRDLASFGRRDEIKKSVRDTLRKENSAWALINDMKHSIREEGRTVITKAIVK